MRKIVTIDHKKCLIVNYDSIKKFDAVTQRRLVDICISYFYRKRLKAIDAMSHKQSEYCHFISEACGDIKSAKDLKVIDKICFSQNPKTIIVNFDDNRSKLAKYTKDRLTILKYATLFLQGLFWLFFFMVVLAAMVVIFSVKDHAPTQMQIIENYSLGVVINDVRCSEYFHPLVGDRCTPSPLMNSTGSVMFHRISNITSILVKPIFNARIALYTVVGLMSASMLALSIVTGFFNANNTMTEKIAASPEKLYARGRDYFFNNSFENIEYEGVKYFAYNVN